MTPTKPDLRRWLECRSDGSRIVHADDAAGADYTLCGYAPEGSAMGDDDEQACKPVHRGKINCGRCVEIIRHCKAIPSRIVAEGQQS